MSLEILFRYLHFVSIFTMVATVTSEFVLLKKEMKRSEIGRIAKIDAIYGMAALTLIAAGLTLWFGGLAKPTTYYSNNWIFLTKIALVLMIAILSIGPTRFFVKQRKGNPNETITVPSSIFLLLRMQLVILAIIPLLAGLMSHGKGYFGK